MTLKPKTQNSTMDFEPITVEDSKFSFNFHKTVKDGITTITANPKKDGVDCGFLSFQDSENKFFIQLKNLTKDDMKGFVSIMEAVAKAVVELVTEG